MTLWDKYRKAAEAYQQTPSDDARQKLIGAYSNWCRDFVPEHAPGLIADFAEKLSNARAA